MDAEDSTAVETDRSTAAERVPVRGAYNITEIGDSLKVGWWEGETRLIKWRNLRWWVAGAAAIGVTLWAVLWSHIHLPVLLFIAVALGIPAVKVFAWYVELADRHATMRLKRKQASMGRFRGWQQ